LAARRRRESIVPASGQETKKTQIYRTGDNKAKKTTVATTTLAVTPLGQKTKQAGYIVLIFPTL